MKRLKERWNISSNFQLAVIFIVFAINGSLSAKISEFLLDSFGFYRSEVNGVLYLIVLLVLVLPLYPFMLMAFGYIFGQSKFFFPFSKKMITRLKLDFLLPKSLK